MATTLTSPVQPQLRPAVDSRPAAQPAPRPQPTPANQPALLAAPHGDPATRSDRRVVVVRHRWSAATPGRLPDPAAWSVSLASAVLETLHGQRPAGQLTRWVSEEVLGTITMQARRRRASAAAPPGSAPVLRSIRIQCPHPEAVEVAAHLATGRKSTAMAFRLEAYGNRWLCTAVDLGPVPDATAPERDPLSSPGTARGTS